MSLEFRKTQYLADLHMNWLDGSAGTDPADGGYAGAMDSPAGLYLAMFKVKATDSAMTDAEEADYGNYAREAVTLGAVSGTNKTIRKNTNAIAFGALAAGEDFDVQGFALYDAVTGGNALYVCSLSDSEHIPLINTQEFPVPADNLTVSEE